eukprot:3439952-Amphidinium_carterae.1
MELLHCSGKRVPADGTEGPDSLTGLASTRLARSPSTAPPQRGVVFVLFQSYEKGGGTES